MTWVIEEQYQDNHTKWRYGVKLTGFACCFDNHISDSFLWYGVKNGQRLSREMLFSYWRRGFGSAKLVTNSIDFSTDVVWKRFGSSVEGRKNKTKKTLWVKKPHRDKLLVVLYNCLEVVHSRISEMQKEDLASWTNLVTRCLAAFRTSLWTWRPEASHCLSDLRGSLFAS